MRIMIDANIFISVALFPEDKVAEAFLKPLSEPYEPFTCTYVLEEPIMALRILSIFSKQIQIKLIRHGYKVHPNRLPSGLYLFRSRMPSRIGRTYNLCSSTYYVEKLPSYDCSNVFPKSNSERCIYRFYDQNKVNIFCSTEIQPCFRINRSQAVPPIIVYCSS